MNCRQDVISYYHPAKEAHRAVYVTETVRQLTHNHDFTSGHRVITDCYDMDNAFLRDSARHLGAALLQFLAHSYLDEGGYITWAQVTRYYSRFFAVMAFTRLVGYATFYLPTKRDGLKRTNKKQFWVVRTNEQRHEYLVGLKDHVAKICKNGSFTVAYEIPKGSGSHNTVWTLLAEICKSWDEAEALHEAAFVTPQMVLPPTSIFDSTYKEMVMDELEQRGRLNYLDEEHGFFFSELDGNVRWKDGMTAWRQYRHNPLSESAPPEEVYEQQMAWYTIRYVASILVKTSARGIFENYLMRIIKEAPANDEMKAQVISELERLLE